MTKDQAVTVLTALDWADQWLNWSWLRFDDDNRAMLRQDQDRLQAARRQLAAHFGVEVTNFIGHQD